MAKKKKNHFKYLSEEMHIKRKQFSVSTGLYVPLLIEFEMT